ncbi:MAG TPA: FtsX-like permease family protein [Thermoanaerobaculia bacterium]|nr:FtsX-like permease family protein [Thermoanaerobaculia bacterium]
MRYAKLIMRNLFRNKVRAALTVLLIAAIFFFVATLLSILALFDTYAEAGEGKNRLAVQSAISLANPLPYSHEAKIRTVPGVLETCKLQWFGGYYKEPKNFFGNFAVDHDKMEVVFDDYKIDPGQMAAFHADRQGAIVGPELVKRFGWKLGDKITLISTIFPFNPELTIRGIYDHHLDSSSLFFRMDYMEQAVPEYRGMTGNYWIKVKDAKLMDDVSRQIDAMFKNSEFPTETFTEKEFQLNFMAMMGNIKLLFTSVSTCAVFMVILLAAITMSMSARERVTEIAVLKAIGFERGLILALMLVEFMILTLFGGALGALGARVVFTFVDMAKATQGWLVGFSIPWPTIAICVSVSALVGLISGGWSALRAANMSVVDGLRRVV